MYDLVDYWTPCSVRDVQFNGVDMIILSGRYWGMPPHLQVLRPTELSDITFDKKNCIWMPLPYPVKWHKSGKIKNIAEQWRSFSKELPIVESGFAYVLWDAPHYRAETCTSASVHSISTYRNWQKKDTRLIPYTHWMPITMPKEK